MGLILAAILPFYGENHMPVHRGEASHKWNDRGQHVKVPRQADQLNRDQLLYGYHRHQIVHGGKGFLLVLTGGGTVPEDLEHRR